MDMDIPGGLETHLYRTMGGITEAETLTQVSTMVSGNQQSSESNRKSKTIRSQDYELLRWLRREDELACS
jgi:hypothetical protein